MELLAALALQLTLHATIHASDHQSYRTLDFDVPPGTTRITVVYEYTGREAGTTIDAGLLSPAGIQGWSGGNKKRFTVSAQDATPSYVPGPVTAGRWSLLLGVPNIRPDQQSEVTATVTLETAAPLREGAGWYRGDLHMHSGHSDGSCADKNGVRSPCPLPLTVQAAADAGLDFIAVTEHNTVSHVSELQALQPSFSRLLLIPGMEVTKFNGHANAFGVTAQIDFRESWNVVLGSLADQSAVVSINHPGAPSGEICMGCGWTAAESADLSRVQAVEVVNGADADTPVSGIPFWHAQLNKGLRLTGIGGSDNHDATLTTSSLGKSRIGAPTTVVYAQELSLPGIQAGIRSGNVFVDVQGSRDRSLDMTATAGGVTVPMGGDLKVAKGSRATFKLRVANVPGATIEWIRDGELLPYAKNRMQLSECTDGARHWVRVNVRDAQGQLLLAGNPIYCNGSVIFRP